MAFRSVAQKERKILLNIKPINYVVTSTYTSDRRKFSFLGEFKKKLKKSGELIWQHKHTLSSGKFSMIYDVKKASESIQGEHTFSRSLLFNLLKMEKSRGKWKLFEKISLETKFAY